MIFNSSKKAHNDKIRLQIIRLVISNRVQMFSTPQKKLITTKYDFKSTVWSFQIESKCFQNHPFGHFKSSPNAFKIIRLVISNRVRMLSTPQKKLITTKYDFKSSVWSFQIESKCFQHLKKSS